MQEKDFRFDLFDIVRIGLKWKKQIIVFSMIVSMVTAIFYFFQKNNYNAYGSFFAGSAIMSGRVNLFRETPQEWIDFFGGENEIDRAYVVANSSEVLSYLITKFNLREHYGIDSNDNEAMKKTYKRFSKKFKVNRSGFKHIEVNFEDEEQNLCHEVVNEAMNRIQNQLREIYIGINRQLAMSLDIRRDSLSKELIILTDSLVSLRSKYGIYDIVAPGRKNIIPYTAKGSGENYARGLELVQNVEELKDKINMDCARYLSLSNEFKTATFDGFPMIHVTQWASPGSPKSGPYRTIAVATSFFLAFFASLFLAIVIEIFKDNKSRILP